MACKQQNRQQARRITSGALLGGLAAAAMGAALAADDIPVGLLPPGVEPVAYRLELKVIPEDAGFSGVTEIDIRIAEPTRLIYLHGNGLRVSQASLRTATGVERPAYYEQLDASGVASLSFDTLIPAGKATLRLAYSADYGRAGEGLYKSVVADEAYVFTQFQPIDARRVFPGFDEPGFKTPFDIAVTTSAANAVISSTGVRAEHPGGDGLKRVEFETTLPLPTYLLALVAGPLDVVEAPPLPPGLVRRQPIPLRGVTTRGKGERIEYALANTAGMVSYLEYYFNVPFPYPKLDLIASPDFGGGMENAGAIIYGDPRILMDENAPFEQLRGFGGIHGHELAHQWFGNLVTPKWWDDIWLNEAFATWMGFKAGHAWEPGLGFDVVPALQTAAAMDLDSRISARQIRNPVERNADISGAFDGITYLKGGAVLSMFESWLGEDAFRAGIRTHMQRFAHDVADVEDFMASLAEGSGRPDVVPAFRSFIDQPGLPLVEARLSCSAEDIAVELRQSRYLPVGSRGNPARTWLLPICMKFGDGEQLTTQCTLLSDGEARLPLEAAACPSFVMPNANGAGYYRFALDDAGWQNLVAQLEKLNEVEALAVADSLSAAYQADRLSTAAYLAAIRTLAGSPYPTVALAPARDLVRLRDHIVEPAAREGVKALMRELYQPRLAALEEQPAGAGTAVPGTEVERALFRTSLVRLLALEAGDRELAVRLAADARRYLRMDEEEGGLDPSAIDAALLEIGLAAGVRELGRPFADTLIERLFASTDVQFRAQASNALASTDDAAVGDQVRGLLLDPRIRGREPTTIGFGLAARPSQRRATFDWFKTNHEDFIERSSTSFGHRWLPRFGAGFCSRSERDEVEQFFTPMLTELGGADRTLAELLENMELCVALAEARQLEATAQFTGMIVPR